MGITVGDTIFGREEYHGGWNDARLTLLWMGHQKCVWHEQTRNNGRPIWSEERETADWTLDCRDWVKVPNV